MTIQELHQYLNQANQDVNHLQTYFINFITKKQIYEIVNENQTLIATIDNQKSCHLTIVKKIDNDVLVNGFLHFANTPLHERSADIKTTVNISKFDLENLISIDARNNAEHELTLTDGQMHALRHFRNQFAFKFQTNKDSTTD